MARCRCLSGLSSFNRLSCRHPSCASSLPFLVQALMDATLSGHEPALLEVCRTLGAFGLHEPHATAVIRHRHGGAVVMPTKGANDNAERWAHIEGTSAAGTLTGGGASDASKQATPSTAPSAVPLDFLSALKNMLLMPSERLQQEVCAALGSLASGRGALKLAICRAKLVPVLIDLTKSKLEAVRIASKQVLRALT